MSIDSNKQFVKRRFLGVVRWIQASRLSAWLLSAGIYATSLLNSGCTHTPDVAHKIASDSGFSRQFASSRQFEHVVYESNLASAEAVTLKVYIEGDGIPWYRGKHPAGDPTPRDPLALRLMAQDSTAAIYVGRPCYFGLSDSRNCSPDLWTSGRYSEMVVTSMLEVVEQYVEKLEVTRVVLIGYSGGGTIATLMARDSTIPTFVLTMAANLDIDAWTAAQGFLPLNESLNPVDFIDRLYQVPQLHLIALDDRTVQPSVTRSYTDQLPERPSRSYRDIDHSCCWVDMWPLILQESPWDF